MKSLISLATTTLVFVSIAAGVLQQPPSKVPIHQLLDDWVTNTEKQLLPAADAMPENKYSFVPTSGQFNGVRTFAEQIKHLAANNYRMAAFMLNQPATQDQESEQGPESIKSKAQIMDYLQGSFVALHKSVATINSQNVDEPLPIMAKRSPAHQTRVQLTIDAIAHDYDHYGQMVEYLRMNGIIPPASRK